MITDSNPVNLDASAFLESHRTLGAFYEPLMGVFIFFSILTPLWLTYIICCSLLSFIHYLIRLGTLKEYQPMVKNTCVFIQPYYQLFYLCCRNILDSILNPTTLVAYPYLIEYFFKNRDIYNGLVYINNINQISYYAKPYFVFAVVSYALCNLVLHNLLRFLKPTYHYDKNILSRFCCVSRFFGSAVIYIVIFDFNNTIDYLLWVNVYFGTCIALLSFAQKILRVIRMSDFPTPKF